MDIRECSCRRSRAVGALVALALLVTSQSTVGCSGANEDGKPEDRRGFGMGGVEQPVRLRAETVNNKPAAWDLSTPESAVRSYLEWVSYAYRTAESEAATPTQSAYQLVRTDAYIQSNLQKEQILDQALETITFGKASIEETRATIPATEQWLYRYVSINDPDEIVDGPNRVSYQNTYHLFMSESGWVVDDVDVERLGSGK